jgi:hypothetical protein
MASAFLGMVEAVGNMTSLMKSTEPPETVVTPLKAGACVEAEESGAAGTLFGFIMLSAKA